MVEPSILFKNGHYHHVKVDSRHIYTVEFNPANGTYFIHNTKTNVVHELLASEFVYHSRFWNEVVDSFPNYVHHQVWTINEHHNQVRRARR